MKESCVNRAKMGITTVKSKVQTVRKPHTHSPLHTCSRRSCMHTQKKDGQTDRTCSVQYDLNLLRKVFTDITDQGDVILPNSAIQLDSATTRVTPCWPLKRTKALQYCLLFLEPEATSIFYFVYDNCNLSYVSKADCLVEGFNKIWKYNKTQHIHFTK